MSEPTELTRALRQAAAGDPAAAERVWSAVYDELRRIAHRELRDEAARTLETTGLVHEAYLKFGAGQGIDFESRRHFYATACRAMRQVLVDRARYRQAKKREAARHPVTLDEALAADRPRDEELVGLDEALSLLEDFNERLARVVDCHFFGGLTFRETGDVLGTSERTAERDWRRAKAYLRRLMEVDGTADGG